MQNKPDISHLEEAIDEAKELIFRAEGGYKAVYEANISGKKEALKVIYIPKEEDDPDEHSEIKLRIKREIESLERCESPFIVKLGSLKPRNIVINEMDFIIYSEELLEGPTLVEQIRSGIRPTLEDCKSLMICLIKVIKELKMLDLIHRDIKPGNIFALEDSDRQYVILDLGIAFKLNTTAITKNPDDRLGTLPYMAPEIFRPEFRLNLDYRSDLYSAALTVYEYAAGVHPVARREDDDFTTMYRITRLKRIPLKTHRSDFPNSFCLIIDQLIRKNPALRPANIEGLIEILEKIQ